jgi:hypothetical protein
MWSVVDNKQFEPKRFYLHSHMEIVSLLVWSIVFPVITTIVASTKGLSLDKWAAIGFILGPIGAIWVLVTANDASVLEAQSLSTGKFKKCPLCAEVIKKEATVLQALWWPASKCCTARPITNLLGLRQVQRNHRDG